jgi:hypothetical protein
MAIIIKYRGFAMSGIEKTILNSSSIYTLFNFDSFRFPRIVRTQMGFCRKNNQM